MAWLAAGIVGLATPATASAKKLSFAVGFDVENDGDACVSSCQAGRPGSGHGQLSPRAFSTPVAGGELFVNDSGNDQVSVFSAASGAFVRSIGDVAANGIAVAGGELCAANSSANRVDVFDAASGAFMRAFGNDVGGSDVDTCTTLAGLGASGGGAGRLALPLGVTVTGGQVLVSDLINHRVSAFNAASGAFVRAFGMDVGGAGLDVCTTSCRGRERGFQARVSSIIRTGWQSLAVRCRAD